MVKPVLFAAGSFRALFNMDDFLERVVFMEGGGEKTFGLVWSLVLDEYAGIIGNCLYFLFEQMGSGKQESSGVLGEEKEV